MNKCDVIRYSIYSAGIHYEKYPEVLQIKHVFENKFILYLYLNNFNNVVKYFGKLVLY